MEARHLAGQESVCGGLAGLHRQHGDAVARVRRRSSRKMLQVQRTISTTYLKFNCETAPCPARSAMRMAESFGGKEATANPPVSDRLT